MNDAREPADRSMEQIRDAARRVAADARELEERSRPAALTGERPELVPRASPALDLRGSDAIHRAEQTRAADDLESAERQQELAAGQQTAAEILNGNAEQLDASRAALDDTRERAADGSVRADDIAHRAERLGEGVSRLRDQVRDG